MGCGQPHGLDIVGRLDFLEADEASVRAVQHIKPVIAQLSPAFPTLRFEKPADSATTAAEMT